MSASKYTPGPWHVNPEYLGEVEMSAGKTVASVWAEGFEGGKLTIRGTLECSEEEQEANARLIAAAPELLEALKYLAGEEYSANHDEFYASKDHENCKVCKIRALIAKTEGGAA